MANTDYKILLKTLIDKTQSQAEINKFIKQVESKAQIKLNIDTTALQNANNELLQFDKIRFISQIDSWNKLNAEAGKFKDKMTEIKAMTAKDLTNDPSILQPSKFKEAAKETKSFVSSAIDAVNTFDQVTKPFEALSGLKRSFD